MESDPAGFGPDPNTYAYAWSNPLGFTDRYGLDPNMDLGQGYSGRVDQCTTVRIDKCQIGSRLSHLDAPRSRSPLLLQSIRRAQGIFWRRPLFARVAKRRPQYRRTGFNIAEASPAITNQDFADPQLPSPVLNH
ncbi:MAG: hypothetical protein KJO09_11755 [Gammaproteobacteria bacterium]|nr:hypothetical protein [Gammaproteobacteria bacterium]